MAFQIQLAEHDTCKAKYQAKVLSFLEANLDVEDGQDGASSFRELQIRSQKSTAPPTAPSTPNQHPFYLLTEELGTGAFGVVYYALDVSTGQEYAVKTFRKGTKYMKEVEILRSITHEHIVRFVDFVFEQMPLLVMEYLPLGNLRHQRQISRSEATQLLCQGLRALDHLHMQNITHRDIKPENILVLSREPFHIKLGDFGLAKNISFLETYCGTNRYCAPEVGRVMETGQGQERRAPYDSTVDIWSLAVVVLEYWHRLPSKNVGVDKIGWCQKLVSMVKALIIQQPQEPMAVLLGTMLSMNTRERRTAAECLTDALKLDPWSSCSEPEFPIENPDSRRVSISSKGSQTPTVILTRDSEGSGERSERHGDDGNDGGSDDEGEKDSEGSDDGSDDGSERHSEENERHNTTPEILGNMRKRAGSLSLNAGNSMVGKGRPKRLRSHDPSGRNGLVSQSLSGQGGQSMPSGPIYDAVVALLKRLQLARSGGKLDSHWRTNLLPSGLVQSICEELGRLRVTDIAVVGRNNSHTHTATATPGTLGIELISTNLSDEPMSISEMAESLLHGLRSLQQRTRRPSVQGPLLLAASHEVAALTASEGSHSSGPWTFSVSGSREFGITYPSGLLDVTLVPGCSIPPPIACGDEGEAAEPVPEDARGR